MLFVFSFSFSRFFFFFVSVFSNMQHDMKKKRSRLLIFEISFEFTTKIDRYLKTFFLFFFEREKLEFVLSRGIYYFLFFL